MQTHVYSPRVAPSYASAAAATGLASTALHRCGPETRNPGVDQQFVEMLDAYRGSGGLARLQEVAASGVRLGSHCVANLASAIAARAVICFEWQSQAWLPLFQFAAGQTVLCPQLRPILAELICAYDPWDVALWFSQPNHWLSDRVPADIALSDAAGVSGLLQAARAARFEACA